MRKSEVVTTSNVVVSRTPPPDSVGSPLAEGALVSALLFNIGVLCVKTKIPFSPRGFDTEESGEERRTVTARGGDGNAEFV